MLDFLHARIITMQYSLVVLLVIISFQAVRAFKERAFYILAAGWIANLFYLITTEHPPHLLLPHAGTLAKYLGSVPDTLDFVANALFWYAAHTYGRMKSVLYFPRLKTSYFVILLLAGHVLSLTLDRIVPQNSYFGFFVASLPVVVIDVLSLTALAYYFGEIVHRVKGHPASPHLLSLGAWFYAAIQLFQLLLYPKSPVYAHSEMLAFTCGFVAKGLIFFGIIGLFVNSAATLTNSMAEKRKALEFTLAVDRLAHELGTPIAEIHSGLIALRVAPENETSLMLGKLQNAAARAVAIVGASPFAVDPLISDSSTPASSANRESIDRLQIINVNTIIEIAQSSVKATRNEKITYQHHYSGRCCLECRPAELVQVLVNVFRNAHDSLKQNRGPSGTISIQTTNEKAGEGEKRVYPHGKVRVIVRDSGEGISQEAMDKIFEEGYSTRPGPGRGFGLSITKRLVEKYHGTIEVHSPPSHGSVPARQGTEVVLTFPRTPCLPS